MLWAANVVWLAPSVPCTAIRAPFGMAASPMVDPALVIVVLLVTVMVMVWLPRPVAVIVPVFALVVFTLTTETIMPRPGYWPNPR